MKCWHAQEKIMRGQDNQEVAEAAKNSQELNVRRNALIRAIDERFGESSITQTNKTYAQ